MSYICIFFSCELCNIFTLRLHFSPYFVDFCIARPARVDVCLALIRLWLTDWTARDLWAGPWPVSGRMSTGDDSESTQYSIDNRFSLEENCIVANRIIYRNINKLSLSCTVTVSVSCLLFVAAELNQVVAFHVTPKVPGRPLSGLMPRVTGEE